MFLYSIPVKRSSICSHKTCNFLYQPDQSNETHTNETHTNETHTNETHTNETHTNENAYLQTITWVPAFTICFCGKCVHFVRIRLSSSQQTLIILINPLIVRHQYRRRYLHTYCWILILLSLLRKEFVFEHFPVRPNENRFNPSTCRHTKYWGTSGSVCVFHYFAFLWLTTLSDQFWFLFHFIQPKMQNY
jgi:hypothetical protein